jgi:DNA-binding MarR family transcriptional regulator
MDSLVQVGFEVIARLSQAASKQDLSLTQLRALAILRDRTPKMAELAAHLGLDRSTVSGLIDRAEARGLVQRESSTDDARAVRVGLTAEGQRLAVRLTSEIAGLIAPMTSGLSAAEKNRLGVLLERLLV